MDREISKNKWSIKRITGLISGLIVIILIIYFVLQLSDSSSLVIDKEKVTICEVKKSIFQESITVTGSIEPSQTIYLDLSDGGKVIQKYAEEGAFLNQGDPIIKLDNPNLALQLMNTQSSFLLAESQLNQTKLTFEQNRLYRQNQLLDLNTQILSKKRKFNVDKTLYEKELCPYNDYMNSKEDYELVLDSKQLLLEVLKQDSLTNLQLIKQSQTNVERSKSYLKLVESQLENLTVKAPIKGQLSSLNAEIGQSVSAGHKLGQIDNTETYKIRAEVDEHYISRVKAGLVGEYEYDGIKYLLNIKTIYPQVINGKFAVDFVFQNNFPNNIKRGQTVHLKLQLGNPSEALVIDNGGFYSTTGGQWIFILDKSKKYAIKRNIRIGRQNQSSYEIIEGLEKGDLVITSSYLNYGNSEKLIFK
jgi:HlyD family secretion protein